MKNSSLKNIFILYHLLSTVAKFKLFGIQCVQERIAYNLKNDSEHPMHVRKKLKKVNLLPYVPVGNGNST